MNEFVKEVQLRWSDLDPNFHLRHSVYYDWGALCRVEFFKVSGLAAQIMQQFHFGPVLFREECVFKREIRDGDTITIDIHLLKARKDYSRWSIKHTVVKNGDTVCAIIVLDGAWIDTIERKLTVPPPIAEKAFTEMPRDENFQWM